MYDEMSYERRELTVTYKDASIVINKRLLDQQNCWDNLDLIKKWHEKRLKTEYRMSICKNEKDMEFLREKWTTLQFKLQEAWGFTLDAKFHRFWDIPTCTCPQMDNNDAWPSNFYTVSGDCPVHGAEVKARIKEAYGNEKEQEI